MDLFVPSHIVKFGDNKVLGLKNCGGNYLTRREWYESEGNAQGQTYFGGAVHGEGNESLPTFSSESFTPCASGCPGWLLGIVDYDPGYVIQRCDDCGLFTDEDEARAAFLLDLEFEVWAAKQAGRRLLGLERRDDLWIARLVRLLADPAADYQKLKEASEKLESLGLRIGIDF